VYDTATALRQAIEARLNQRAREDGVEVNRLRRGFVFERIMARLELSEPGAWVVKGGMALEWRLGKRARGTRDLDLVLRGRAVPGAELRDRLDLVRPAHVLRVVRHVFESLGTHDVPAELPDPPAGWTEDYAHGAGATSLRARTLQEAMSRLRSFWREALAQP
jgi:hypothetical protein